MIGDTRLVMADVVGARVKCPECGANSDAIGDVLKCSYCGTTSRVQRRTQFGLKVPLPPRPPEAPQRVAVQVNNRGATVFVAAIAIFMSFAIVSFVMLRGGVKPGKARAVPVVATVAGSPAPRLDWISARPLVLDLDDDGVADAIGMQRDTTADQMFMVALGGASGNVLWRTPSLGTFEAVYRKVLAFSAGVILVGDRDRDQALAAYDATTGKPLFTAKFSEVVDKVCVAEPGTVNVITKDNVRSLLDLKSGQVSAIKAIKGRVVCAALPSSNERQGAHLDFTMRHSRELPGMTNDSLFGHEAPWIVTGVKNPGSRLPMLAALDAKDKVLWTTVVPLRDPMSAKFQEPAATDVEGDLVATVYIRNEHEAPVLTAFDRRTGARKFETPLRSRASMFVTVNDVMIGKKIIYVTINAAIQAFDRDTGVLKWAIGETR